MNLILNVLFPKRCVGCGKFDSYFCADCVSNIMQGELICPFCERLAVGGATHPICRRRFGLDGLWSLGIYQDSLRSAIQKLKYKWVSDLAEVLVDIMIEYWAKFQPFVFDQIKKDGGKDWVIVPVPLFWWRENKRGYNQAALIGQLLSKKLGLDYLECLKRTRFTRPQVKLTEKERRKNIRNAFEMDSRFLASRRSGRGNGRMNILLIDDVWTTGSTTKECCYVLKRAGAKKVWVLTLAR
ncbi:MAG: ComF family protein [Patescibacteria group bacterium]